MGSSQGHCRADEILLIVGTDELAVGWQFRYWEVFGGSHNRPHNYGFSVGDCRRLSDSCIVADRQKVPAATTSLDSTDTDGTDGCGVV